MKRTETEERTFFTTTIVIDPIADYSLLEKHFRLIRYLIPDNLKFVYKKNLSILFGRIYNAFRDQVGAPYRSYTFDKLDGENNIQWAFYVMYPRQDEIAPVSLPWYQNEPLQRREIRFQDLPRHVLIKLLQIRFCQGNQTGRFVGQDKCYVYADSDDKKDIHVCAEIEIKGASTNKEGPYEQEFRVIAHARRFVKATPPYSDADALFAKHPIGNKLFFSHLKQSALQKEANVYRRFTSKTSRAHLMYHNTKKLDAGRGKIVYDFIPAFLEDLAALGISGHIRKRSFLPASSPDTAFLPTGNLHTVGVFDNRLDKTHPLDAYVDLFNTSNATVQFIPLPDLSLAPRGGAFVLLDARAEDFEEGGILYDKYTDPYPSLYKAYPTIPKQSLNVNPNDIDALAGGSYLDYPLLENHDTNLIRHLDVGLNELYLKCSIIHGQETYPLPLLPDQMAFVRRRTYDGTKYTVALCFENNQPRFIHLENPEEKPAFYVLLKQWGIDWLDKHKQLLIERNRFKDTITEADKELPSFDILVGPDLFVAIEDLQETVLYQYEEIQRRKKEQTIHYPINDLLLAPSYDRLQEKRPPLVPLEPDWLIGKVPPKTKKAQKALAFYHQLLDYDDFLQKEVAITHPILSFEELTESEEWVERIAKIFGSKKAAPKIIRGKLVEGKYHCRLIIGIYQDLDKFLSEKGQEVHLYQGIWHDETNAFTVGSPTGMNIEGQDKANPIRRFQILQGADHFDKEQVLSTMGVKFVRFNQYTVSPYYFHLIDVYVESILSHRE
jgi:hypothetical protein